MPKPSIALTMGDPAGVGPELVVQACADARVHEVCRPLAVGSAAVFRRALAHLNLPARLAVVGDPADDSPAPPCIACLDVCGSSAMDAPCGIVDARAGHAAYEALVAAARLALAGQVAAVTTAPLNKAALWKAGHEYPGHTELLSELCGVTNFAMMLYLPPGDAIRGRAGLGVVHVTLHQALREVFAELTLERVLATSRLAHAAMWELKGAMPKIGVCALNPHGGEAGLFGTEELTVIAPAVDSGCAAGLDLHGPHPADTLLARARDGEFDGVVAMYHDQGHIALKLLDMQRAVNITLGLPIVRTSVAHGTAFDLAWQGRAQTSSMIEAIRVAARLARERALARRELQSAGASAQAALPIGQTKG